MNKVDGIETIEELLAKAIDAGESATAQVLARGIVEMIKELPDEEVPPDLVGIDWKNYEVASTSHDGLPPNEGIITFGKKNVGYDWWDVEKDGIPELEPKAEYMYTWKSQQGRELVARRAGDGFYAIGRGLYDRDTVTSGDRVIRICKTRGVD